MYAATATFYECLTGRPPFGGDTAERLMHQHLAEPVPLEPVPGPLRPLIEAGMAKDPGRRPADAAAFVTELRAMASGAYGPDWEQRGRSGLAGAAVLLAALWPSGAAPAVQGSAVHRVRLRRHIAHGHAGATKAAVAAGVVIAGGAIASAAILAAPAGHATRPPAPTATAAPARATTQAPAPAPAPAQLTGTQLASALLPISDFPAGYENSASGVAISIGLGPDTIPVTTASCRLAAMPGVVLLDGGFFADYGTAAAANSFFRDTAGGTLGAVTFYLNEAVFQFASPAEAEGFFSSVRTCLIDNEPWSNGVDSAPVDGDQAITGDFTSPKSFEGGSSATEPLFVLQGTDVFGLSAASDPNAGPLTIPGATELITELIARVDALSPATSAAPSPVSSAVASSASSALSSPALSPRQQAAQALAVLLAQSGTDRTAISKAFKAVAACSPGLSQDETIFSTAAASRQDLLGKLAALTDRSALPASMLQDLTMAWQASGEADQDFAAWTQDEISRGCSTDDQSDPSYRAVKAPDDQATAYKKAFVGQWTAIADEYGLPVYQYNQI